MVNPTAPTQTGNQPTTIGDTTYLAVDVNMARMAEMGRVMGWAAFGQFHFDVLGVALSTNYHAEVDTIRPIRAGTWRVVFAVTCTPQPKENNR